MKIRIAIAGQQYLVREGLRALVSSEADFAFAGEADGAEMLRQLSVASPFDVLIIDHLQAGLGLQSIRAAIMINPALKILAITQRPGRKELTAALDAGVCSYLLTECDREEILDAIRATAQGEQFFCGKIVNEVMASPDEAMPDTEFSCDGVRISAREVEIIRLVAEGLTNKEIADRLCLSAHTVTTHRKNIMNKLGVNNTAGLVLFAIRNNIVTPNHFLFNTN
ncbi:MAG: response regulator transcription factor [Bacteroidia bacterium]|jgi:DNA-binding NarL/FixJ family response regulator|nr:response regulator transcription factor [Bacteroidia bacterium]